MSRLIDRVMVADSFSEAEKKSLMNLQVIDFSNVSDYMYPFLMDQIDTKDFPNIAPPFRRFWMETRAPKTYLTSEGVKEGPGPFPNAWGFIVQAFEAGSTEFDQWILGIPPERRNDVRWLVDYELVLERRKGKVVRSFVAWKTAIQENGEILTENGDPYIGVTSTHPLSPDPEQIKEFADMYASMMLAPIFLAITFMHCKNVQLVENTPPAKASKRHKRECGYPLFSYRTIVVEPIKKILASSSKGSTDIKMALHICRGHFKNFDLKPLFGKHKGMYWWESHVRGNEKYGHSEHGYVIETGQGGEQCPFVNSSVGGSM